MESVKMAVGRRHLKEAGQRAARTGRLLYRREAALLALGSALNLIDAPAFVIDLSGVVLHANTNARALLDRDRHAIARSLERAIAGAPAGGAWELMPLRGTDKQRGFVAILRTGRRETPVGELAQAASGRWRLIARQAEVLDLVVRGFTNALIADSLGIGEGTVEFHLSAIFDKAGVESRAMLIARALGRLSSGGR